jgi:hypothetical protein
VDFGSNGRQDVVEARYVEVVNCGLEFAFFSKEMVFLGLELDDTFTVAADDFDSYRAINSGIVVQVAQAIPCRRLRLVAYKKPGDDEYSVEDALPRSVTRRRLLVSHGRLQFNGGIKIYLEFQPRASQYPQKHLGSTLFQRRNPTLITWPTRARRHDQVNYNLDP